MISNAKYDFQKVHFSEFERHVRLSDLKHALITERFHGRLLDETPSRRVRNPWADGYVSVRPPRLPIIQEANEWAETEILADLRDGSLPTYVSSEEKGAYYAIQADFWQSSRCGLSVGGTLLDFTSHGIIPEAIAGNTIYVSEEPAFRWLLKRKIKADNPDYPRSLRKVRSLKTATMPPDSEIRAKMEELMAEGYTKNAAAKRIGLLSGFESVGNLHARRVVEELGLKPGRRKNGVAVLKPD